MPVPSERRYLRGIDYFQLLIDHHNKKNGGLGHATKLAIVLKGVLSQSIFLEALTNNAHCRQLAQIRVDKTYGLGYPSIVFDPAQGNTLPVSFHELLTADIPEEFYHVPVEVFEKPPLHIQVFYLKDGNTTVLFSFHHILFDFSGVQSLIASLCGTPGISLLPAALPKRPFIQRLKAFFQAVAFTFREANWRMTAPARSLPACPPRQTVFRELRFSPEETRQVFQQVQTFGPAFQRSAFLLASACKALHDEIFSQHSRPGFMWAPVAVNMRKKGAPGAILLNGLSFFFYKLKPADLSDIGKTTHCIQQQMKEQMRRGLPQAFLDFADAYWYVPLPIYYPMFNLPSMGKLSSFSFSVLGDTFSDLKEFMGLPVIDVRNYPSNSIAPGITLSFYEFRGQLRLMSSWVKDQYSPQEQAQVLERVRYLLLSN